MLKTSEKNELFRNRYNTEDKMYFYMYCLDDTITNNSRMPKTEKEREDKNIRLIVNKELLAELKYIFRLLKIEKEYQEWKDTRFVPEFEWKYNNAIRGGAA